MKTNFEHIDGLIAKVIAGEATRVDIDALENWLNDSSENKIYFEETKKLFATIDSIKRETPVDIDAAWKKLDARIDRETGKVIPLFRRYPVLKAAASILLIAALGFILKWAFNSEVIEPVILMASNKAVEQKLPDGSKVFINKNSEVTYVINENKEREVKLKGEAYFEVVHNEKEPFIIIINDVMIKDIGTAFNVKAIPGSNSIEVLVEEGEVLFYTANDAGINLVKGQKALYDISAKSFVKNEVKPNENTGSYHSKAFYFNETSLIEVITQINEVYGSDIRLASEKMGNCSLSVEFNNESLDVIVSIIAETLDLQVEQLGTIIILKGSACNE